MIKSAIQQTTIGNILRQKRRERELSLENIAEATKIRIEYLQALEKDDYSAFPSDVYAKGFLKNYAKFLGIRSEQALALYRRNSKAIAKSTNSGNTKIQEILSKIVITPNRIIFMLLGAAFIALIFYLSTYLGTVLKKPELKLTLPIVISAEGEYEFQTQGSSVDFAGKVDSVGTKITINGEDVAPTTVTEFSKNYKITEPTTKFVIKAVTAFGRESIVTINVVKPQSIPQSETPASTEITGFVTVTQNATKISIFIDGVIKVDRTYNSGTNLDFLAYDQVLIKSSKASSFSVTINSIKKDIQSTSVEYNLINGQISEK